MAGGFDSLGLIPELIRAINDLGWLLPTDVQDEAIPLILGGGDVMVAAETGSGKTAAFSLPMIQCVHETLRAKSETIPSNNDQVTDINVSMNLNDKDALLLLNDDPLLGVLCESPDAKNWAGGRGSHGICGGKYCYEVQITSGGICRVGWSTKTANLELGKDSHGFGYGGTGKKSYGNQFIDYGEVYSKNDFICCYFDYVEGKILYSKNGKGLGVAFNIPENIRGATFFPAILLKGSSCKIVFEIEKFKYSPVYPQYYGISRSNPQHIISSSSSAALVMKGKRRPLAIVLEPSRDLAEQVYQNIQDFIRYLTCPTLVPCLLVGGDNAKDQQKQLSLGVDIIVATVGKAEDMLKKNALDLSMIRFFILDEADRLTDPENSASVNKLFSACPSGATGNQRLQGCFFSATLHSPEISQLSSKICVHPVWVDLKGVDSVPETVHHVIHKVRPDFDYRKVTTTSASLATDGVHVKPLKAGSEEDLSQTVKENKMLALLAVIDKFQMSQCMIFCRTNVDCDNLEAFLVSHGSGRKFDGNRQESGKLNPYSCAVLAGMRSMEQRRASLEAFKEGEVRFLISTDVGARGIDVKGLPYVINLTLPDAAENYIHRIGRVGRAEKMGLAISIVAADNIREKVWWHNCKGRGVGCTKRALLEQGGCTKWQSEGELLRAIEDRLHQPLLELGSSFELPEELAKLNIVYGEESKAYIGPVGVIAQMTQSHVEELRASVRDLNAMEVQAQNMFLCMKMKFNQGGGTVVTSSDSI